MMQRYIAITIGPINKTFEFVRKTRELWAASYVFSYLSKRMLEEINSIEQNCIISPYIGKVPKGVGLYPDRIFISASSKINKTKIEKIEEAVISEIAIWLQNKDAVAFLKQYFRIIIIEYQIDADKHPILFGNQLLDNAELQEKWELIESPNLLLTFFRDVNKLSINNSKWLNEHLDEKDVWDEIRFESLPEIATRLLQLEKKQLYKELVKKYCYNDSKDLDNDDGFIFDLKLSLNKKGQNEIFKNYNKYICIVKADGDKVGKYINSINSDHVNLTKLLSKALFEWGEETAGLIKDYKGVPIFLGGDDLLFIAPVVGSKSRNIVDFVTEINNGFRNKFEQLPEMVDENGVIIKPTLSFGISISYYKYPLNEALNKAELLLKSAKSTQNNLCNISLLKHSGSSFDVSLSNSISDPVRISFESVNKYFTSEKTFLSSIIHHFRLNQAVYALIGNDQSKTENYLMNNFDDKKHEKFVKEIAGLCTNVYCNHSSSNDLSKNTVHELFSLLRILKFMKGLDDGK